MKNVYLLPLLYDTKLILKSNLSQAENFALTELIKNNKSYSVIANEANLSAERVRQLIANGIGKILFTIKDLLNKSNLLESIMAEKNALEQEVKSLKSKLKGGSGKEHQIKMDFLTPNISINEINFSVRARGVLDKLNIKFTKDLLNLSKAKLDSVDKAGVKTIDEIIRRIEEYGIMIK